MNNSRRKFIKNSTLAVAGTTLLSNNLFAAAKIERLGIQLYSVRTDMTAKPQRHLTGNSRYGLQTCGTC